MRTQTKHQLLFCKQFTQITNNNQSDQFKANKAMKTYLLILIGLFAISPIAEAQVKIGSNPTSISATSNLEIEASNGKKVTVDKTTGALKADGALAFPGAGTPAAGAALTSDATGNATWIPRSKQTRTVITGTPGSLSNVTCAITFFGSTTLTLPTGYWTVIVGGTMQANGNLAYSSTLYPYSDIVLGVTTGTIEFTDRDNRKVPIVNGQQTEYGVSFTINVTSASATVFVATSACGVPSANISVTSFKAID
ncbi:hypothetical protein [Spirosoma sordidisoli]|uniref:Uncharacterized protein n=1 Tax=Spirosoma sordidisoli TaxID=2502893 RepID=A0A4Q2ULP4_9BACT|nr:hypothetical protein [Spirosoma sordidisoli]RYC68425.1 hypothetical protein EQG79_18880 [Spirosoma sordidisoli]